MSKIQQNKTIWNLGSGDFFFTGFIVLYQNHIKKVWSGKYELDSLDSFAKQFKAQGEGKHFSRLDRYTLWLNYKNETKSEKELVSNMLDDIPADFVPQRDMPDFYDFLYGKSFTIKNNYIKVYTTTAIVEDDCASLLQAAMKIVSSLYNQDSPASLYLIRNKIVYDSIDVADFKWEGCPDRFSVNYTSRESKADSFSFRIYFDMEISYEFSVDENFDSSRTAAGPLDLKRFDFIPLFLEKFIVCPKDFHLDKKNCFYYRTPKDTHEQDLIYAEQIVQGLNREYRYDDDCAQEYYWMAYHAKDSASELKKTLKECEEKRKRNEVAQDYIEKYGENEKVSKKVFLSHLKKMIDCNPLDFTDYDIESIALYAQACVTGESL
ncbi:MAG: hypothetical protein MJY87_01675 [Fibrobacter sp.]|nr:hypothetical protein [Fibrobacter sp.]